MQLVAISFVVIAAGLLQAYCWRIWCSDNIRNEMPISLVNDETAGIELIGSRFFAGFIVTHKAADILNVSRPYLVKLLEAGEIPFAKKGTHRRVFFKDIEKYKTKIDEQRMGVLDEISSYRYIC